MAFRKGCITAVQPIEPGGLAVLSFSKLQFARHDLSEVEQTISRNRKPFGRRKAIWELNQLLLQEASRQHSWSSAMFKIIGALVVYSFAAYGLTQFLAKHEELEA